ncbi:MAG: DNA methylase N-4 [Phycisphaerae bacterium]|nr:DNA methylase N-4 [Phycisphaerae bacterium]
MGKAREFPAYKKAKVSELIPYARNSRTHSEAQVSKIASSIKEFGFLNPVITDGQKGIVAGHGRLMAAQKIGMDEVPTIDASHLTEAQRRAYVIADNRLALDAGWDDEMLKIELGDLDADGFDLSLTGFDLDEIASLTADEPTEGLTDEDAVPDAPEQPITVEGDVWLLGRHRLMCGDSTSIDAVDKLMDGRKANICFTSPPYNAGSLNVKGNARTIKKYNSFDDNQNQDEFSEFLTSNMNCMLSVSDEVFYNIGLVQNNKRTIFKMVDAFGDTFKDVIYWKKKTVAPHIQKGVINNLVEFILCFGDGNRKFINPQFGQGTYWNVIEGASASGNEYSEIHKATFPVYLPENIIINFTGRNAIVIDSFGGTGTTLIACEKTARDCRMMELDPKYCDVIIKRWQDFTGKDAIHIESGKPYQEIASVSKPT